MGEFQDDPLYARYLEGRIVGEREAGGDPAIQPLCFVGFGVAMRSTAGEFGGFDSAEGWEAETGWLLSHLTVCLVS